MLASAKAPHAEGTRGEALFTTQSVEFSDGVTPAGERHWSWRSQVSVEQLVDSTLKGGFCHHLASTEAVVKTPAL